MGHMKRALSLVLALAVLLAPFALFASTIALAASDAAAIHQIVQAGDGTQADHCPAPLGHEDKGCTTHCITGAVPQQGAVLSRSPRIEITLADYAKPSGSPPVVAEELAGHASWRPPSPYFETAPHMPEALFALTGRYRL